MSKQRKNLAQVRVASPCAAEWDAMKGNDAVRFCEHCAKHVHNLSAMTPRRAQRLVELSDGNLCVRYYPRPSGAPNINAPRLYPLQRQVSRLAAGAFTAVLSVAANLPVPVAAAASPSARATQAGLPRYQPQAAAGDARLTGAVKSNNEKKPAPVPHALVRLINRETNKRYETTTNKAGEFTLEDLPAGTYRMLVKADGYEKYRDKAVTISGGEAKRMDLALQPEIISMIAGGMGFGVSEDTGTELAKAVRDNNLSQARQLIGSGQFDVNGKESAESDTSLLNVAITQGYFEMTKLLLESGAKADLADSDGNTVFMQLDGEAGPELVGLLVKHGAKVNQRNDEGETTLHLAAYRAKPEVIQALIKAGAEVNAQDDDGATPLMMAAGDGNVAAVRVLLEAGANLRDVDDEGDMAWHFLNSEATPELVKLFLDAGIDIGQRNKAGQTLLLRLAGVETKALATLIKAGADVNATDNIGATPLMNAASHDQADNLRLLLKAGADIQARDNTGLTPLMSAAMGWRNIDAARLLLKAGAEINARTNEGYTALSYALTSRNGDMIKLFKSKGGVGEPIPQPQEEDPEGEGEP